MKKQKHTGPDMFGAVAVPPPKAKTPPAKPRETNVAEVCGAIAGMPRGFRDAGEALRDVRERCALAGASTGILSAEQAMLVASIEVDCAEMMHSITGMWKAVDAMIACGIALPEKEAEELFG